MQPVITTDQLYLREFSPQDAETLYLLNLDPEVIQFTGDDAFHNVEEAANFIAQYDHYKLYNMGRWAVVLKDTDAFLGWCGLKYSPELDEFDIGFRFFKAYWNRGYATESATACIDYGFNILHIPKIIGRAVKANAASVKVLEKIGLTFLETKDFHGMEGVIYAIENQQKL